MTAHVPRTRVMGNGIDEAQERVRRVCGIELPRKPTPKPRLVVGVVPVVCEHCHCTGTRPLGAREFVCFFCGKTSRGVIA